MVGTTNSRKRGKSEFFEELQKGKHIHLRGCVSQFYNVLKPNGICVLHLGVVPNLDIGKEIVTYAKMQN